MWQETKYVDRTGTRVGTRLFHVAQGKARYEAPRTYSPWGAVWERRAAGAKIELIGFEDPECPRVVASRWTFRTTTDRPEPRTPGTVWEESDFRTIDGETDPRRPSKRRARPVAVIEGPRGMRREAERMNAMHTLLSLGFVPDGEEEHRLITIQQRIHSLAPLSEAEVAAPRDWMIYEHSEERDADEWIAYNVLGEEIGFQLERV